MSANDKKSIDEATEILLRPFARYTDIAWAWEILEKRNYQNDGERYQGIRDKCEFIELLKLPFRNINGVEVRKNRVKTFGEDAREYQYLNVNEIGVAAVEARRNWPALNTSSTKLTPIPGFSNKKFITKDHKARQDAITPVIIDAYNDCINSTDAASNADVLARIAAWANNSSCKDKYPTLLEEVEGEIKWQSSTKVEILNQKRLGDRLRKLKSI